MLVLSRGPQDKVLFPNLGVSVEILRISGNRVRLGVDAPQHVRVLRHELMAGEAADEAAHEVVAAASEGSPHELDHRIRNRLNTAHLALGLAEKQLNAGMIDQALGTLHQAIRTFDSIDAEVSVKAERESEAARQRALLVEDDKNECELLAGFRMSGFEVDTAEDGLQAMVYLSRHERPDVVLMDMHMPRFDGARAVQGIRQNPEYRDMKVFAVTGAHPAEVRVEVGPQGVDRWFHKPINPQRLVESIKEDLSLSPASSSETILPAPAGAE